MTLRDLLNKKGIKQKNIAITLEISEQAMSYKLKHDAFTKQDLQILRQKGFLDLQDLDELTKVLI